MLTQASGTPREKLIAIFYRWEPAKVILGPVIETLPVLLALPIILFIAGLIDNLFSRASQSSHFSSTIRAAAWVATGVVFIVGALLLYALVHACVHPNTSPFRNTVSGFIRLCLGRISHTAIPIIHSYLEHIVPTARDFSLDWSEFHRRVRHVYENSDDDDSSFSELPIGIQFPSSGATWSGIVLGFLHRIADRLRMGFWDLRHRIRRIFARTLSKGNYTDHLMPEERVYHRVLQVTHDDDSLNQASAALPSMLRDRVLRSWKPNREHRLSSLNHHLLSDLEPEPLLSPLEIHTLIHLLSPEASYRSNLGAAQSIMKLNSLLVPLPSSCKSN